MTVQNASLPSFANPPVSEVVLSVQFEPLTKFQVHHFGLLWSRFRGAYPSVEQQPPLDPVLEIFPAKVEPPRLRFELQTFPLPRTWFINLAGDQLLQVQRDRFMHNWRKVSPDGLYPRYSSLRPAFAGELREFMEWCDETGLGLPVINQCEVTYVNRIRPAEISDGHGQPHRIASLLAEAAAPTAGTQMESLNFVARYRIDNSEAAPCGRLYVEFAPAYAQEDGVPVFVATLTARGEPIGADIESAFAFLDHGHEVIVNSFKSLTTREMHNAWGLSNHGS